MAEDGGVLENLPRARPGKRSEKRPAAAPAEAAARAERVGADAAEPARAATPRPHAKPSDSERAAPRRARPAPSARRQPGDPVPEKPAGGHPGPVGGVIRGAVKVAGTGARVVGAVAGEVLRRLPRP
jgi:hypothetical protein